MNFRNNIFLYVPQTNFFAFAKIPFKRGCFIMPLALIACQFSTKYHWACFKLQHSQFCYIKYPTKVRDIQQLVSDEIFAENWHAHRQGTRKTSSFRRRRVWLTTSYLVTTKVPNSKKGNFYVFLRSLEYRTIYNKLHNIYVSDRVRISC